jgi:CDP-diacylglycerol--glycerol-3-phosphate 3-phosphatidyltransferase
MSGASPLLNIPNFLSFLRLPLAVVFILTESPQGRAAIIVLAAITDGLDGWAARRLGQQSGAGQLVDPITDKLFVLVALATMTARGELAAWMVLLLLARDIYTSFAFFVVLGMGWHVHFKARFIGKTVTVLQFSTLIAALLWPALVWILLIATTIASAIAISDYTLAILAERRRLK